MRSASRGDPAADRAKAGRTGAPRNGRRPGGRWSAGRRSACLGRARCLAARGGYVNPASKGTRWCPGASRRSIPSLGFARDRQTSDALRRETIKPCPSFRGACAPAQANPESRHWGRCFNISGFRVRAEEARPGMTNGWLKFESEIYARRCSLSAGVANSPQAAGTSVGEKDGAGYGAWR
jgi:hypothetical protein